MTYELGEAFSFAQATIRIDTPEEGKPARLPRKEKKRLKREVFGVYKEIAIYGIILRRPIPKKAPKFHYKTV